MEEGCSGGAAVLVDEPTQDVNAFDPAGPAAPPGRRFG
jgi:hypothetical protein